MFKSYPKLSAVILTYAAAFGAFAAIGPESAHALVEPFGIGGIIVAGALYTYGFTASLGAVLLVALAPDYAAVTIALLGGVGATIADLTIFRFFKGSIHHEMLRIAKTEPIKSMLHSRTLAHRTTRNLVGFLVIASPLPDEIGVALLTMTRMKEENFRMLDFVANVLGIYALALLSHAVY